MKKNTVMSSRKSTYVKFFITVLLAVDICACFIIYNLKRQSAYIHQDIYRGYLTDYCMHSAQIGTSQIQKAFEELDLTFMDDSSSLGLFIPPYPCGACVKTELEVATKQSGKRRLLIVAPEEMSRDIKVSTADKNIKLVEYCRKQIQDQDLIAFSGVIYFHLHYGMIDSFYLSNEHVVKASQTFLNKHCLNQVN